MFKLSNGRFKLINNNSDLLIYEKKIFSQSGEDGITMRLINLLYNGDNYNKYYVEFGTQSGVECNTRILRELYNWNGLLMDGSHENLNINLRKEFITKENIINLFEKYNVPSNINILSVDIDSNDFYVLNEILKKYTCDIIICEYNSHHSPYEDKIVIYDTNFIWDGSNYFGASLLSLTKLCNMYGYTLIYCNKIGVNCFFINNKILETKNLKFPYQNDVAKLYIPPIFGNNNNGHPKDKLNRLYYNFNEALAI
jgi:hypothetical protein